MVLRILTKIYRFFYFGNRKYDDYRSFLIKAKLNNYEFKPLKEFVKKRNSNEKIIGLRHDVDTNLDLSIKIAEIEKEEGIKSTYFILHTAKYFYQNIEKEILHPKLIKKLKYLQNDLGHEIGIHSDLMPIEHIYKLSPKEYLKKTIKLLDDNGIDVKGIAGHGNLFKNVYMKNFKKKNQKIYNKNIYSNPHIIFNPEDFLLEYEAYSLDHDLYYSDSDFIKNKRWDFTELKNRFFNLKNKRVIILTHAVHWSNSIPLYYSLNFFVIVKYFCKYLSEYRKFKSVK